MWGERKAKTIDEDAWHCDLCGKCALKVKDFIESNGGKVIVGYYTDKPPCYIKQID